MNYDQLEKNLIAADGGLKDLAAKGLGNIGKIIALITVFVAGIITFCDVSFASFDIKRTAPSVILVLICSYIIYFSLESSGELSGSLSEEYINAKNRFLKLSQQISGSDIKDLRKYLEEYSRSELDFRRGNMLLYYGISKAEFDDYATSGCAPTKAKGKKMKRILKMKPIFIPISTLLSLRRSGGKSELESPEKRKYTDMIFKLIPTTICTFITVSLILSTRDGMSSADIFNGILKLCTLPVIGFKGFLCGYNFSKYSSAAWLMRRADILEGFINKESGDHAESKPKAPNLSA